MLCRVKSCQAFRVWSYKSGFWPCLLVLSRVTQVSCSCLLVLGRARLCLVIVFRLRACSCQARNQQSRTHRYTQWPLEMPETNIWFNLNTTNTHGSAQRYSHKEPAGLATKHGQGKVKFKGNAHKRCSSQHHGGTGRGLRRTVCTDTHSRSCCKVGNALHPRPSAGRGAANTGP